jgi:hypothetical protein
MRRLARIAAVVFLLVGGLAAQSRQLSGTVRNAQGAVLPGVTVTLSGPALEKALRTVTSALGTYAFGDLPAADGYTVTFSLVCFSTETHRKVSIGTDKNAAVDAVMRLGTCEPDAVPAVPGFGVVPVAGE